MVIWETGVSELIDAEAYRPSSNILASRLRQHFGADQSCFMGGTVIYNEHAMNKNAF